MEAELASDEVADTGRRTLSALRIGTAISVLISLQIDPPWVYGHLPDDARITDDAVMIAWTPVSTAWVVGGSILLAACCVALIAGWRVRAVATLATILAVWVLGVPQMFTPANHNHHLVWLLAIVALSAGTRRSEWWVRAATLVVGAVYLFPGIAKLLSPGWITSDNLYNLLAAHRAHLNHVIGFLPPRWASSFLAAGAVLFEIGFVVVALTRYRRWAAGTGIVFHLAIGLTTGIWFWILLPILGALLIEKPGTRAPPPDQFQRASAALLVAAVWLAGAGGNMDAWPFAAYPLFNYEQGPYILVKEVDIDGVTYRAGAVLIPDAPVSRQVKIERHDDEMLEHLILLTTGHEVTVQQRLEMVLNEE